MVGYYRFRDRVSRTTIAGLHDRVTIAGGLPMNGPLSLVLPAAMALVLLHATALTPKPAHAQSQVEESNPYLRANVV